MNKRIRLGLVVLALFAAIGVRAQEGQRAATPEAIYPAASEALVTVIAKHGATQTNGTGVVVRADGLILTAYNLVKDAGEVQVKLQNGEVFDHAEVVKSDERRNAALLRIPMTGLPVAPLNHLGESSVGASVSLLTIRDNHISTDSGRVLSALTLADEVPGAGNGFRVLKFTGAEVTDAKGGVLVDNYGNVMGLLAALPEAKTQNYAVSISPLTVLMFDLPVKTSGAAYTSPPAPSVVQVNSNEPRVLLANARKVHVDSRTTFFKPAQLINELSKRESIKNWNWLFVDELYSYSVPGPNRRMADLEIELDHQIFTYNFTFTLKHVETGIILASGKVTIADGASGAPKMADRIIEKVNAVLNPPQPKEKKETKDQKPASKPDGKADVDKKSGKDN